MRIEPQFAIFLDNRPGLLAKTCNVLAQAKISILAMSILDAVDHVVVRMVVDKPKEAERVLGGMDAMVQRREVVVMDIPNQIGTLASLAEKLTEAGINIEYAYCTTPAGNSSGALVLRTNDLEGTINALS